VGVAANAAQRWCPEISADFQQQFQRFAHLLRVAFDIGIEQRFSHDLQRQPHHLLMRVAFFPPRQPCNIRCVYSTIVAALRSDSRAVKRRLGQPPLPQPEFSFAGQQAFAKDVPVRPQHPAFRILARVGDQHFFDQVGMVDEDRLEIQNAHPRDVAILARDLGEIFQRMLLSGPSDHRLSPSEGPAGNLCGSRATSHDAMPAFALRQRGGRVKPSHFARAERTDSKASAPEIHGHL